jgi:hypothetical protein
MAGDTVAMRYTSAVQAAPMTLRASVWFEEDRMAEQCFLVAKRDG